MEDELILNESDSRLFEQLSENSKQAVRDLWRVHKINALAVAVELEKDSGKIFT